VADGAIDLGQVAYEAYAHTRGWRTFDGDPMPQWADQAPVLQDAWRDAANTVAATLAATRLRERDVTSALPAEVRHAI
jgi:hypothetical protein